MPVEKADGQVVITTSQSTQKHLNIEPHRDFITYLQFGVGKKDKARPRVVVNHLRGLRNTRDKYKQHILLEEAGIKKPKFMRTAQEAIDFINETGKWVVAKLHNHSRGRGMYRIKNEEELYAANPIILDERRYYFEEFVTCNREWRIHVSRFHDEEVVAYRKCLLGDVVEHLKENNLQKPWVRNLDNCYFKLNSEEDKEPWFGDMVAECKKAIEVLGMDIAGFDVGENNKVEGGDFYIYEANSCCGMEENTREHYERAINDIVQIKARNKGLV